MYLPSATQTQQFENQRPKPKTKGGGCLRGRVRGRAFDLGVFYGKITPPNSNGRPLLSSHENLGDSDGSSERSQRNWTYETQNIGLVEAKKNVKTSRLDVKMSIHFFQVGRLKVDDPTKLYHRIKWGGFSCWNIGRSANQYGVEGIYWNHNLDFQVLCHGHSWFIKLGSSDLPCKSLHIDKNIKC